MALADLLFIRCQRGPFQYRHYGIDVGDGTVVHLATCPEGGEMFVQRVALDAFSNGAVATVEAIDESLPPAEVVERAIASVGIRGYDLLIGNCEHFARYLKTGKGQSIQIDMVVSSVVRTAFSGFVSTVRRHVIASTVTAISQSKILIAAGSLVPTMVGETARHGTYFAARKLKMTHAEAERSSRSVGHAASAVGGFVVGGPAGAAGALAISVASDRLTDALQRRLSVQN